MPKTRNSTSLVLCPHRGCQAHHLVVLAPGRPSTCSYCGKRVVAHPLRRPSKQQPAEAIVR